MTWLLAVLACAPHIPPGPVPVEQAATPRPVIHQPSEEPLVRMEALIRAGSSYDPIGAEGLAHLTARVVAAGMEPLPGELELQVGRDAIHLVLHCPVDAAPRCAEQLGAALAQPDLQEEALAPLRQAAVEELSSQLLHHPVELGHALLMAWLYEGHPYAHPVQGRVSAVERLDATTVADFHTRHYLRSTVRLGTAGPALPEVEQALERALKQLPGTLPADEALMPPPSFSGRHLLGATAPSPLASLHLGHPLALGPTEPDYLAMRVGMAALEIELEQRLVQELRLAGAVGASVDAIRLRRPPGIAAQAPLPDEPPVSAELPPSTAPPLPEDPSSEAPTPAEPRRTEPPVLPPPPVAEPDSPRRHAHLEIWLGPSLPEALPHVARRCLDALERLVAAGLQPEELEAARRRVDRSLRGDGPEAAPPLRTALRAAELGAPELPEALRAGLESLSLHEVNAALAEHLRPDTLRLVAIGPDATALRKQLIEGRPPPYVDPLSPAQAELSARELDLDPANARVIDAEGVFR